MIFFFKNKSENQQLIAYFVKKQYFSDFPDGSSSLNRILLLSVCWTMFVCTM